MEISSSDSISFDVLSISSEALGGTFFFTFFYDDFKTKTFPFVEPASFCITCSYIVRILTNSSRAWLQDL